MTEFVVCVDGSRRTTWPQSVTLTKGTVYTLLGGCSCGHGVLVAEAALPPNSCWRRGRFRPVDDDRLTVFRRIAASPRERIRIGEDA